MNFQHVPPDIQPQVSAACQTLEQHLGASLCSIHLYGSALQGGLQPLSDIDLLVTVSAPLTDAARAAVMTDLLAISAWPGTDPFFRALEVTIVLSVTVTAPRFPLQREMQFGEWLREDIEQGIFESAMTDPDLAILLTKVRLHSAAILGEDAAQRFAPVSQADLRAALLVTLSQWNTPANWHNDECNIILALARIAFTLRTGRITTKSDAADALLTRLHTPAHRRLVQAAKQTYLTGDDFDASDADAVSDCILSLRTLCEQISREQVAGEQATAEVQP